MPGNSKDKWQLARPKKRTDDNADLAASCYCGDYAVMIPKEWVGKRTKSCKEEECKRLEQAHLELIAKFE